MGVCVSKNGAKLDSALVFSSLVARKATLSTGCSKTTEEKKGVDERATESTMVLGDGAQSKKEERGKKRKGKNGRIGVQ